MDYRMNTEAQTLIDTEEVPSAGKLLSAQERLVFEQLASGDAPHSPWARALLAIDEGASRAEAAQRAGMTSRQVRYWLAKFRKLGPGIFPRQALDAAADELVASMPAAPEGAEQVEAGTQEVDDAQEANEAQEIEALEADVEELTLEKKAKKSKDKKKKKKGKKGKGKKKDGKKGKSKKDKSSKKSKKDGKKKSKKAKR